MDKSSKEFYEMYVRAHGYLTECMVSTLSDNLGHWILMICALIVHLDFLQRQLKNTNQEMEVNMYLHYLWCYMSMIFMVINPRDCSLDRREEIEGNIRGKCVFLSFLTMMSTICVLLV